MKYYIIAGEASGDLHGSNLIHAIVERDKEALFRIWGGDMMDDASGAKPFKHIKDLAIMGFVEVVKKLPTVVGNLKSCKRDILQFKPDVIVFIDFPGFNLRIAEWAKKNGFKTVYYISPQIWAWKEKRIHKIKRSVDEMLVILPFEKDFYKKHEMDVHYVGHPLIDVIEEAQEKNINSLSSQPIIALLPGSRTQEIQSKLPIMLSIVDDLPEYHFIIAQAPSLDDDLYERIIGNKKNVSIVKNQTYNLLRQSQAALVTSGTATLETALFQIPQVVCYKTSNITYQIAKRLVNIKFISLVNLIMDKLVVKELIQKELNTQNLKNALKEIIEGGKNRKQILEDYQSLWKILYQQGASQKAANIVVDVANR